MFGICIRYAQNRDDAQDILQEGFIKVFQNLNTYKDVGPLGGWIRKIILNTALEHCRKNKGRYQIDVEFGSISLESTEDTVIDELALKDLVEKIQQLPNGYRAVFNLYAIEGYNHSEIAELMSISEGTSKSQYSKAKAMLRSMIDSENNLEDRRTKYA